VLQRARIFVAQVSLQYVFANLLRKLFQGGGQDTRLRLLQY